MSPCMPMSITDHNSQRKKHSAREVFYEQIKSHSSVERMKATEGMTARPPLHSNPAELLNSPAWFSPPGSSRQAAFSMSEGQFFDICHDRARGASQTAVSTVQALRRRKSSFSAVRETRAGQIAGDDARRRGAPWKRRRSTNGRRRTLLYGRCSHG